MPAGRREASRSDLALAGSVFAVLAALLALLLPFLVALGLPLRLALLAFLLVFLEGAARPTVPFAIAATVATAIPSAPVLTAIPSAPALPAVPATLAAASLSSLAHGCSSRWFSRAT